MQTELYFQSNGNNSQNVDLLLIFFFTYFHFYEAIVKKIKTLKHNEEILYSMFDDIKNK